MSLGDIGKILPSELYTTELEQEMPMSFSFVLTHLYQPLIGVEAIVLYQTLFTESQLNNSSDRQTHHGLMTYLGLPLDRIYRARRRLEAIGLLQTFEQYDEDGKLYHYVLHIPHTGRSFFANDFLSHLLYHQLGSTRYKQVKSLFTRTDENRQDKKETTATFEEVFRLAKVMPHDSIVSKDSTHKIPIERSIDFQWLEQILKQRMLPVEKILTEQNRETMIQMAAAYNLTDQEIEKALLWAITEENELNISEFKAACTDFIQTSRKASIQITEKPLKAFIATEASAKPKTKEEQLIERLETISPKQLLEDLADGKAASTQDLKIVSDVMTSQGLNAGVMNVLLHYVLLKTDMKLSKNYLETIASHWARKNVKTVRQAMTLAKSENKKYQQWKNKPKTTSKRNFTTNKKDIVPDWYKNRNQSTIKKSVSNELDREKQATEADELLNNYLKQQANQE
ncbi:replication initiation and membrane attachment protein [Gracilibacillus halotolerans]|uniref:Replication initiation and membrane attachment protein n=1 Tax=Gracilibacillus halotolerans TaxID=74386 RepID=A0A841RI64_9BACI|nr:DnaD domain protein [Gracilibacillus halotolerans]MBB6513890.1 replication initiation and membrane attachment protein [Gracilibacillus halotolerans]